MAGSTKPSLVVDASSALAWFFDDEESASNDRILNAIAESTLLVPPIWELEICNAFLVAERQKRIELSQTQHWIELLQALEYTIEDMTALPVFTGILHLARAQQLSSYDASYLSVALHRNALLMTRDKKLQAAAKQVGVALFV